MVKERLHHPHPLLGALLLSQLASRKILWWSASRMEVTWRSIPATVKAVKMMMPTKSDNDDNTGQKQKESKKSKTSKAIQFAPGTKAKAPIKPVLKKTTKYQEPPPPKRRKKTRRVTGTSKKKAKAQARHSNSGQHKLCLDTGTDSDVIGGHGWTVIERHMETKTVGNAFMGEEHSEHQLPIVTAVTAHDHPSLVPILLGVGAAAFDDQMAQEETLINLNFMGMFIDVDERLHLQGGWQSMTVDKIEIPILVQGHRLPYINVRKPTQAEMQNLSIHWIIPKTPDKILHTSQGSTLRHNPKVEQPPMAPLTERLGNCPQAIADKTLEATTQYCKEDVATETREILRRQLQ